VTPVASDVVALDREGPLAVLTIDRPPLNLFGPAIWEGLAAAVGALTAAPPRGLLIRAVGKVVSGGVEVAAFTDIPESEHPAHWTGLLAVLHDLESLPCPTVFAAHALTLTAVFELALGCDLIVAAPSARFGLVERRLGLTPAMGGTQRIAQRAGSGRALEMVMSGALYDAATMHAWGVVNHILDEDGFADAAQAFARELAEGPTIAHAATKQLVRAYERGGLAAADAEVAELATRVFATDDARGAIANFVERGPAHGSTFTGA
jgi:enoyl-CoA hydratase